MFQWDVGMDTQRQSFHIKRGGLYYVSLNTFLSSPTRGFISAQLTTTTTTTQGEASNKTFTTEIRSASKSRHVHLNRVLLFNQNEIFYLSVFCSEANQQISASTSISLHFLSPYDYAFGFIANIEKTRTIKGAHDQTLVSWKPYFERMQGFFATTGDFLALKSGYYLITFQMTLRNVYGEIVIILMKGGERKIAKQEYYKQMSAVETLTYTTVYKVMSREKIRFIIQTPDAKVDIDPSSSYSAILIETVSDGTNNVMSQSNKTSSGTSTVNYQLASLQQDNHIAASSDDQEIQLVHWKNFFNNDSAYLVNSRFQIRRSSFYFVHVEVHFKDLVIKDPPSESNNEDEQQIRTELRLETSDRYKLFRQNRDSRSAYFFGVFYIKNKQSISISIVNNSPYEITVAKHSTKMFIYELKLQTYASLFEIMPAIPPTTTTTVQDTTQQQYPGHAMRLAQKQTSNCDIITTSNSKDGVVIQILKKGIYYAALDVHLLKNEMPDHNDTVIFTVMSKLAKRNNETWTPIARCIGDYRKQCFIPLILTLNVGQSLFVSRSDAAGNSSLEESHFHLSFICPASSSDTKDTRTLVSIEDIDKPIFKLPAAGYYLITGSLILRQVTVGSQIKIDIKYKRERRTKSILSMKKKVWQPEITVSISEGFDAQEDGDTITLSVELTDNDGRRITSFVLDQGIFSYMLITKEKDRFKSLKASTSTISPKGTVDFVARKVYYQSEKYISDRLFLRSVQSITSLVTVNLIGRIMPKRGRCADGQTSKRIHARIQNEAHFQTYARRLNCGETVGLHLSGVVTTHPTDFIKVDVELDGDFVFKVSKHSSITMFVLKDSMPFTSTSIDFLEEDLTSLGMVNLFGGDSNESEFFFYELFYFDDLLVLLYPIKIFACVD